MNEIEIFEEDGIWFAYSKSFDLYGYGKTKDKAVNMFKACFGELIKYALEEN